MSNSAVINLVSDKNSTNGNSNLYKNDIVESELKQPVEMRISSLKERNTVNSDYSPIANFAFFYEPKNLKRLSYISNAINWVGYVTCINESSFSAKLFEENDNSTYEIAEFELNDISDCDRILLKEGAIFYWSVGHANHAGQVRKESFLRFKRSVNICNPDVFEKSMKEADELMEELVWG